MLCAASRDRKSDWGILVINSCVLLSFCLCLTLSLLFITALSLLVFVLCVFSVSVCCVFGAVAFTFPDGAE